MQGKVELGQERTPEVFVEKCANQAGGDSRAKVHNTTRFFAEEHYGCDFPARAVAFGVAVVVENQKGIDGKSARRPRRENFGRRSSRRDVVCEADGDESEEYDDGDIAQCAFGEREWPARIKVCEDEACESYENELCSAVEKQSAPAEAGDYRADENSAPH